MKTAPIAARDRFDGDAQEAKSDQAAADSDLDRTPESLSGLLDHFIASTKGQENVAIIDLLKSLRSRSHGPMLLLPAIMAISPLGMIPGMSVITGSLIILIATQMMLFSDRPWIPKRLENAKFSRTQLIRGVEKTKPWVRRFERVVHHRAEFLASGLMIYPVGITCILLALAFFPLSLVPFGVFAPGFAVTMFALGLTARDGLLVMLGFGMTAAAATTIWFTWPF